MTTNNMTSERLNELIAAYGSDPQRWPVDERDEAVAFMDAHPTVAQAALQDAQNLDQLLDGEKRSVTSTDFLAARILKAAQAENILTPTDAANDRLVPWRKSTWKSVAATFAITAAVGFTAGQSAVAKSTRMDTAEALLSVSINDTDELETLWEDL